MIYTVVPCGVFKCPRKIHLNTQCPPGFLDLETFLYYDIQKCRECAEWGENVFVNYKTGPHTTTYRNNTSDEKLQKTVFFLFPFLPDATKTRCCFTSLKMHIQLYSLYKYSCAN